MAAKDYLWSARRRSDRLVNEVGKPLVEQLDCNKQIVLLVGNWIKTPDQLGCVTTRKPEPGGCA